MTNFVFLALSRTGPDPMRHELVEVAAILRQPGHSDGTRYWHVRPEHLEHADEIELRRNRYLERRGPWEHNGEPVVGIDPNLGTTVPASRRGVADQLARALVDAYLVTLGLEREPEFLREFLRRQGYPCAMLGHIDVTAVAAGAMYGYSQGWAARSDGLAPSEAGARIDVGPASLPLSPFRLAAAMGLHVPDDRESAYNRALLAGALWSASTATPPPPLTPPDRIDASPSTGPTPPVEAALDVLVAAGRPLDQGEPRTGRDPYGAPNAETVAIPIP